MSANLAIKSWAESRTGRLRSVNQDSFLCASLADRMFLAAVADGMGGGLAGDEASKMALYLVEHKLRRWLASSRYCEGKLDDQYSDEARSRLREAIESANRVIYQWGLDKFGSPLMGTTITAGLFVNNKVYLGHVGDSRVYLLERNQLYRLTEDHSLVSWLVKSGNITEEEAMHHPQRNVLTRALGTEYDLQVDLLERVLKPNDVLIFCTDGLTNFISDKELLNLVTALQVEKLPAVLVDEAVKAGGHDDVTVVVVKCCFTKGSEEMLV